ncbi:protein SET DOMAIN GROUP 41 isoform X1 [Cucurbita pepo subsp. pepo]|uniref:protein SET DOMAIN GROUP 41 isoform X1 n=1 Tax=Cucurbita pepo subsp. pepo TaxID=3664 RepID=UPI000C9D699F|nr:protein SET DOMAIN GROUP 41 isoform X1 [Cucurbita pepo subsp. pepo]
MEMEMRAMEDIEMAEDITPPLPPLTAALHDAFLLTHCSSCFSPLPNSSISHSNLLRYCSPICSHSDSLTAAVFSTGQFPFSDTSDLRASLRLLHLLLSDPSAWRSAPPERIFGLLTNREKLMLADDDSEVFVKIREGSDAMAASRRTNSADIRYDNALEEAILCLVLTNAVEVQDSVGRTIGIAVYHPTFCWINHSCSPNACYRFETPSDSIKTRLRISPFCTDIGTGEGSCSQMSTVRRNFSHFITKDFQGYGPRVMVRSIKSIRNGEAVTIAYCDLLQPKAMRQSELRSRYKFVCSCQRCSAKPPTYVDHALQEISAVNVELLDSTSISNFDYDTAIARIDDYVNNAIAEYLSIGSSESCCEKLQNLLTLGFYDEQAEDGDGKQLLNLRLHPVHFLLLNAYTALASAYKVRSWNGDENQCNATMSKTSAAYSLFLAGATHHLFLSEPSLIASAANCWVVAGESLLILVKHSSLWGSNTSKSSSPMGEITCLNCSWVDKFNTSRIHGRSIEADFREFSIGISNCIANISQKYWSFLAHECSYLKAFTDPFDFSWPKTITTCSNYRDRSCDCSKIQDVSDQDRQSIFELGIHCLFYGGYLASICYGHHSHLASQIQCILHDMN